MPPRPLVVKPALAGTPGRPAWPLSLPPWPAGWSPAPCALACLAGLPSPLGILCWLTARPPVRPRARPPIPSQPPARMPGCSLRLPGRPSDPSDPACDPGSGLHHTLNLIHCIPPSLRLFVLVTNVHHVFCLRRPAFDPRYPRHKQTLKTRPAFPLILVPRQGRVVFTPSFAAQPRQISSDTPTSPSAPSQHTALAHALRQHGPTRHYGALPQQSADPASHCLARTCHPAGSNQCHPRRRLAARHDAGVGGAGARPPPRSAASSSLLARPADDSAPASDQSPHKGLRAHLERVQPELRIRYPFSDQ